jgi:hypothetical protein
MAFTLPAKIYYDGRYLLAGKASSKLSAVTYEVSDPAAASIDGNKLHILKAVPFTITARQNGDQVWAATSADLLVKPLKRLQTIVFTLRASAKRTVGETFNLLATINSQLPITIISSDPNVVSVNGLSATVVGPGKAILTATQPGDSNHAAAKQVKKTVTVK